MISWGKPDFLGYRIVFEAEAALSIPVTHNGQSIRTYVLVGAVTRDKWRIGSIARMGE